MCNMEARPNLALKAAQISQNWRKTSFAQKLCKKLLETKKVARNTTSCQKVGEQLVESSRKEGGVGEGEGVGGYSIKLCSERLLPQVQSLTLKYTIFDKTHPFRVSSIKKLYPLYLLRENKSVRKEVFRSFSSNLNM